MEWIVFGDDWGAHPSTTQHLVLNLPSDDSAIWIDSIGMRQPRLHLGDIRRIYQKSLAFMRTTSPTERLYQGSLQNFSRIKPKVIPWHLNRLARRYNRVYLRRAIQNHMRRLGMRDPVLLTANPVIAQYLDAIPHRRTAYLRLDDYAHYPGVDPELVSRTEDLMIQRADAVVATAKALLPHGDAARKSYYLPQGVLWEHFASVRLDPPRTKVLGFLGTTAEWLDFELIEAVAHAASDWTLEFVGQLDYAPAQMAKIANLSFRPSVPFGRLPQVLAGWTAAWIPFRLTELTVGVNPLKLREYLAAGLPTHCTSLPEVMALASHIHISNSPSDIVMWLEEVLATDTRDARRARRNLVQADSWASRCVQLRQIVNQ